MTWFGLLLLFGGLVALFALWDFIFCGGRRCRDLGSRAADLFRGSATGGRRRTDPGDQRAPLSRRAP